MTHQAPWPAAPAGHGIPPRTPGPALPAGPDTSAAPCARRTARTTAALAAVALAAHGLLLATHNHGLWLTALIVAMSVACGTCAVKAWRRATPHGLSSLLVMSLAMMVLHVALFLGSGGAAAGHAGHHAGHSGTSASLPAAAGTGTLPAATQDPGMQDPGMQGAGMLGIAGLELAVAWSAGFALRRQR